MNERAIEEASAWLALLRSPRRTRELEQGFQRWKEEHADHCAAFEAVNSMWEVSERLPRPSLPLPQRWQRAGFRAGLTRAVSAVAAAVLVVVASAFWYLREAGIATDIGEQRVLTLEDGTRVHLNTDTRVVVRYTGERRGIGLRKGEALFEVAPRGPEWPFVVTAGSKQVTALGTAFVVKRSEDSLSVVLVEGRVNVAPVEKTAVRAHSDILTAGQRITFDGQGSAQLDRPEISRVTAWRQGRVELDDTPLIDAVREMNRYTEMKIDIEQPEATRILVKGAFRAGDTASFAQSVASTCHLLVIQKPGQITLAGVPSANCRE